jgi:glycosyltransferase involved in cell wall biosynthesis
MPRILILCEYPTLLGGERSMLSTLGAVAAAGFDVVVAGPPTGALADAVANRGLELVAWSGRDQLAGVLDRVRPDLVHANSLSTARASGPVVAAAGLPSIGHLRDIVKLSRQAVADVNCQRRLLAVSRATRDFQVAQGIDALKCGVLYNGVDLTEFRPRPASGFLHRALGLPADARVVAVIGQISVRKGTDVALTAAWHAAGRLPNVHWLVVGERTSEKEESQALERLLHNIAAEAALAERVHFLGTRDDVASILPECALLVHAARQDPLARVLLEAAASGIAVVASDVGGTREIFPPVSECAVLVPAGSSMELANAIVAVLRDDDLRESLGRAARRRAEAAFDVTSTAGELIDEYRNALP